MLPKRLALVDDDTEFSEFFGQHLQDSGVEVKVFSDSDELLTDYAPYDFEFYVIDLTLPGIDGVELIRVLRRRTNAGILVVSGRLSPDAFEAVMNVGADMYLAKPVRFEQIVLAVKAIHRRVVTSSSAVSVWKLDQKASELIAPDATRIMLSDTDMTVLQCFLQAKGSTVSRDTLRDRLGLTSPETPDNALHATIYRLRRRIEKATPLVVPLQSQSRVGYVFKASLVAN